MARLTGPSSHAPGTRTISRRDFLNGALIASGGLALGEPSPLRALGAAGTNICDGDIGRDPRALRSGNLPSAFNAAHWLRDRRLRFESGKATLAPGCDGLEGQFDISSDCKTFDVIIVGAGLSGLSAAFYLLRRRPGTKILILDANSHTGGNAARDGGPPLPVTAASGGAYCVAPYAAFQEELYGGLGIEWEQFKIASPVYSYFFDAHTPGVKPGHRGWNIDTYGKGLEAAPYSPRIVEDLLRCRETFRNWPKIAGAPTDPPDSSSPDYDYLSGMTLDAYLTQTLRCDPAVSDFYTRYAVDAIGGTARQVNAHTAISFLSGEYGGLFTFPGGTSELALRLAHWLANASPPAEIRLGAVCLRADDRAPLSQSKASVTYVKNKIFWRTEANAVILACQSHSARHLAGHLAGAARQKAWNSFNTVPAIVANVGVKSAAPFAGLGMGYNQYWWGSRDWASFIIADWKGPNSAAADRPTVLTFFGGNTAAPDELPAERVRLLQTPFADYERSLRADLSRLMAGTSFDFGRDVTSVSLYRWGHGMILPTAASVFGDTLGADGRLDRAKAPRRLACAPMGPIVFAGQDSEGTPSVECALSSGLRAANEALALL